MPSNTIAKGSPCLSNSLLQTTSSKSSPLISTERQLRFRESCFRFMRLRLRSSSTTGGGGGGAGVFLGQELRL